MKLGGSSMLFEGFENQFQPIFVKLPIFHVVEKAGDDMIDLLTGLLCRFPLVFTYKNPRLLLF